MAQVSPGSVTHLRTRRRPVAGLCLLGVGLTSLGLADVTEGTSPALDVESGHDDWSPVSQVIVSRMALQPGERVLIVGAPGRFDALIAMIRAQIEASGAVDLGAVSINTATFTPNQPTEFSSQLRDLNGAELRSKLRDIDVSVMMPGATPENPVFAALQEILRSAQPGDPRRMIHFHWQGAYALDGTLLEPDATVDTTYRTALLETDYSELARRQLAFEDAMRSGRVRVTTPSGTNLSFEIGDRPVTRQDGDASAARATRARNLIDREVELPAGVVRVAPVEATVSGRIVFPDADWSGRPVQGLTLIFERGRVVDVRAEVDVDAVLAELEAAGPAGRAFREFALGFNPLLTLTQDRSWIPYYGYGAGVVRLSLGDNTELGGPVGGGYVRWNFFVDASVFVDEAAWVVDGQLVSR